MIAICTNDIIRQLWINYESFIFFSNFTFKKCEINIKKSKTVNKISEKILKTKDNLRKYGFVLIKNLICQIYIKIHKTWAIEGYS